MDQVADFAGDVLLGMTAGPLEAITEQGLEHLITHEGDDIEAHNFGVNTGALHPLVPMSWGDLRLIPANWQVGVAHRSARPPLWRLEGVERHAGVADGVGSHCLTDLAVQGGRAAQAGSAARWATPFDGADDVNNADPN